MTLTATPDRVREADASEVIMLAYWRTCLENGTPARVVEGLITAAVDYEPLLGLYMDECTNRACNLWVEEDARDEHGDLFCSDDCRDAEGGHRYDECVERHANDFGGRDERGTALRLGLPEFQLRRF